MVMPHFVLLESAPTALVRPEHGEGVLPDRERPPHGPPVSQWLVVFHKCVEPLLRAADPSRKRACARGIGGDVPPLPFGHAEEGQRHVLVELQWRRHGRPCAQAVPVLTVAEGACCASS